MSDAVELEFDLKLLGDGISIDKKIDKRTARAVVAAVMGDAQVFEHREVQPNEAEHLRPRPPLSLREFLNDRQATTKPDQIVAIGHYVIEYEKRKSFTRDDVKERFATAKEPMPSNFPRDFNVAVRAGMIDEMHGEKGSFYVTRTGQEAIEGRFGRK